MANNNESPSTKLSLFFANKGLYPDINFDIVEFFDASICEQIFK